MAVSQTGATLWTVAPLGTNGAFCCEAAPLLATPSLLVTVVNATLCGLDPSTGLVLWKTNIGSWTASGISFWNGMVYAGMTTGYAVNAATGSIVFKVPGLRIGHDAVVDGVLYGSNLDMGQFCAYNATTGSQIWCVYGQSASSPGISNGVVYTLSMQGALSAINASNGNIIWIYSAHCPSTCESDVAVGSGYVYIGTGNGLIAVRA
jgi:outer membrane protein assembly factor BamB